MNLIIKEMVESLFAQRQIRICAWLPTRRFGPARPGGLPIGRLRTAASDRRGPRATSARAGVQGPAARAGRSLGTVGRRCREATAALARGLAGQRAAGGQHRATGSDGSAVRRRELADTFDGLLDRLEAAFGGQRLGRRRDRAGAAPRGGAGEQQRSGETARSGRRPPRALSPPGDGPAGRRSRPRPREVTVELPVAGTCATGARGAVSTNSRPPQHLGRAAASEPRETCHKLATHL
ncbi:MAG: hypothetical protein JWR58_5869 [Pseudonocardia sp.]|nr:hypothetical protein [Pseudonocardia sp.]